MRTSIWTLVLFFLPLCPTNNAAAQDRLFLGFQGDVLVPVGTFRETHYTGFGATGFLQFRISDHVALGAMSGYYNWSGKTGTVAEGVDFKGFPLEGFLKLYLLPPDPGIGVYFVAPVGVFFGSTQTTGVKISSTSFVWAPGGGFEFPLGGRETVIDLSGAYSVISFQGEMRTNIVTRLGVKFRLGE